MITRLIYPSGREVLSRIHFQHRATAHLWPLLQPFIHDLQESHHLHLRRDANQVYAGDGVTSGF
jgi:hypothetical protein